MIFRTLPDSLHAAADVAAKYFRDNHGVLKIEAEKAVHPDINYVPTFSGTTRDHHVLSVDVTSGRYTIAHAKYILECSNLHLPVQHYIAFPVDDAKTKKHFWDIFKDARSHGVGIVEVSGSTAKVIQPAVDLSLSGVRIREAKDFAAARRQSINDAIATFKGGDPPKGCSNIYDELEALTRKLAKKTFDKGLWKTTTIAPATFTGNWNPLLKTMIEHADYRRIQATAPGVTDSLLQQVLAITAHRNDSNHKPKSQQHLIQRNTELRTRFEHALDRLWDLDQAVRPLRL